MHHLPFTLAAYFLNGVSVLTDKFLLSNKITNPLIYIFYISVFSLAALVLIPFTQIPSLQVFLLASSSTILWTLGLYALYKALCVGLVTRVVPIIGALIPIMLLLYASYTGEITQQQIMAVILLIFGILFLTLFEIRGKLKQEEIIYELLSAILFSISYILLHAAYMQEHFFTVFVWSRVILVPIGLLIILIPVSRYIVLGRNEKEHFSFRSKSGVLFLIGQAAGGASELLLTFSVSLANPALVNSLQGSQYVFLFIASVFLAKKYPEIFAEQHERWAVVSKVFGILLVGLGLYIMFSTGGY